MRLPNGYGSVVKLSGKRRRPYMIRKTSGFDERNYPIYEIIGYTATREEGLTLLAQYNNDPWDVDKVKITLQGLFDLWREKRAVKLGTSNQSALFYAFKHCAKFVKLPYRQIKAYQMQETIDLCGKGYSTQGTIKNLWNHLDRFALELDIVERCYSDLLTSESVPDTSRTRFTDKELNTLWEHQSEPWVDTVLIFIYSGWRISELLALTPDAIDLKEGTMKGGTKTRNGKDRIVPIHSLIHPFIEARLAEGGEHLICYEGRPITQNQYRAIWRELMGHLAIQKTPHECRHTFESLLDSAGANRKCIDLMMGHKSKDTGNRVYNHKTIEELKFNIELVTH